MLRAHTAASLACRQATQQRAWCACPAWSSAAVGPDQRSDRAGSDKATGARTDQSHSPLTLMQPRSAAPRWLQPRDQPIQGPTLMAAVLLRGTARSASGPQPPFAAPAGMRHAISGSALVPSRPHTSELLHTSRPGLHNWAACPLHAHAWRPRAPDERDLLDQTFLQGRRSPGSPPRRCPASH
jgi:hypothetical protein